MTRLRRTVVLAVAGTLAAGALTTSILTVAAHAGSATVPGAHCQVASATRPTCFLGESVPMPLSASVSVTAQPANNATVSWTISCARDGNSTSKSGTAAARTPFQAKLALPRTNGALCSVSANVTVSGQASMSAGFSYTLGQPVMIDIPQGANYSGQPIYALRCLSDPGNNPALRTPAAIEGCDVLYSQAWTSSRGELVHGRYCLTDKGNGGARSKVILYTCTHAADQTWTYRTPRPNAPEGEYVLKAHGGRLCLEDPKASVKNGTQLIVDTCNNNTGQRWYTN
jgi:hypothetical protein